jgi:hypothetical protein
MRGPYLCKIIRKMLENFREKLRQKMRKPPYNYFLPFLRTHMHVDCRDSGVVCSHMNVSVR